MRELTVRIRFVKPALGNVKDQRTGRFGFARNFVTRQVTFLGTWHRANLVFAARVLGRHQEEVKRILWDVNVDGAVAPDAWYRRYYTKGAGDRARFVLHESFKVGQVVGINCVTPAAISDDDLWQLMQLAGKYRGLSPAKPGEFGHYEVVSIRPRRDAPDPPAVEAGAETDKGREGSPFPPAPR